MVSREKRAVMIQIIENLIQTNRAPQYWDLPEMTDQDPAIVAISRFIDTIVDDQGNSVISFKSTTGAHFNALSRWKVFLQTDTEYSWPESAVFITPLTLTFDLAIMISALCVIAAALLHSLYIASRSYIVFLPILLTTLIATSWIACIYLRNKRTLKLRESHGDFAVWPFVAEHEYASAIRHVKKLAVPLLSKSPF